MRLKLLELKAFGPFTDQIFTFDSVEPGLHIIFGPNEAGKSSSLRGLKALLYGFHSQTPDNFLHSYDQLLVAGCLENKDGKELSFQRRKRRLGDLQDMAGDPLDINNLTPFLQGVEPHIFESLYGLDHRRLVEGGDEILSQKGEVGQTLFAAGVGLSSLKRVIDQFEQEAADLFKSAGQLPAINKGIKRFKELKKQLRETSFSAKEWKDLQKKLEDAQFERERLEKNRDYKNKELLRLERLQQVIPELASLNVWQDRLQALEAPGKIPALPPDIGEHHLQLDQAIREAKSQLYKDSEKLKQLEDKRKTISLNKALLGYAELVDDFHQRLGEYRKGQKDKPERNGMRINLRAEASLLLKQIRPDLPLHEVESLRPVLAKEQIVQDLSGRFEVINEQIRQARKQTKAAELETQEVEKAIAVITVIAEPEHLQALDQAVKLARKSGDLDSQIKKHKHEFEQNNKECLLELKRIGNWSGDLAALQQLNLPLAETLYQFEQNYQGIIEQRRGLEKDREEAAKELKVTRTEIKRIEYGGEIPSEEELTQTRERRQNGWHLLRRQWLDGEDVTKESRAYDPEKALPKAYEGLVKQADLIADRLRNEADRVASVATLRSQTENLQESLADYDKIEGELNQRQKELNADWTRLWEPVDIEPLSPKEMSGWLTAIDRLRYQVTELLKKEQEILREETQRTDLLKNLVNGLAVLREEREETGTPAHELGPIVVFSESLLEKIDNQRNELQQLQDRHTKAQKVFAQATEDLTDAQESLANWRGQWKKALSGLGLKEEISAPEAHYHIDTLQNCLDKVKEADDLQKRIDGINRDADEFETELKDLLQQVDFKMLNLPFDQAISHLRTSLVRTQKDKTRYDQLGEDIDALQSEVSTTRKSLEDLNTQMAELLKIAKCKKTEELRTIIKRFEEYQKFQEKISIIVAMLAKIGGGATVDELVAQAAEVDSDELPGRIETLRQDIKNIFDPERNQISQEIGEISNQLKVMDGSAQAAEASEQMEQELTRIRRLAEHYFRVKLASRILQQEIERYRKEHQDPVMEIASHYFADLTLNSFTDLKVDMDDKGEPILVGICPDGKLIKVAGMSDGTRDQLYLALRLATLEWRMETSEPMPFIVDDILVNFDDDRSRAALASLAELSRKNQVILFTHHHRIVEQAEALDTPAEIVIHLLPA